MDWVDDPANVDGVGNRTTQGDLWAERDPRPLHVIDPVGRPTVDDHRTSLARQLAETALTGLALLAIEDRDRGQFIGYCGLIVARATWEEPEIAFELFRWHHRRGHATEAGTQS
jgi:RimJ/RimL family protein N-acetyltransferase